jgi:hypothetical protein
MTNRIRRKAVWGSNARVGIAITVAMIVALVTTGCSQVRQGQAASYLIMTSLTGSNGCGSGTGSGSVLSSDVECGSGTATPSVIADSGQASFLLQLKDPGGTSSPNTPSPVNAITLTQYHVDYTRSDGHNVQGVDVPYSFDGAITETISGAGSVGFTLVRLQAKEEAPLAAIVANNIPLTVIATVTFYGHDQTGRQVSVSGNIQITFADFSS